MQPDTNERDRPSFSRNRGRPDIQSLPFAGPTRQDSAVKRDKKIEVTGEMTRAGAQILVDVFECPKPTAERLAVQVFREMLALSSLSDARKSQEQSG